MVWRRWLIHGCRVQYIRYDTFKLRQHNYDHVLITANIWTITVSMTQHNCTTYMVVCMFQWNWSVDQQAVFVNTRQIALHSRIRILLWKGVINTKYSGSWKYLGTCVQAKVLLKQLLAKKLILQFRRNVILKWLLMDLKSEFCSNTTLSIGFW